MIVLAGACLLVAPWAAAAKPAHHGPVVDLSVGLEAPSVMYRGVAATFQFAITNRPSPWGSGDITDVGLAFVVLNPADVNVSVPSGCSEVSARVVDDEVIEVEGVVCDVSPLRNNETKRLTIQVTALTLDPVSVWVDTGSYHGSPDWGECCYENNELKTTVRVVERPNRAPLAKADVLRTRKGAGSVRVIANDSDPDGDAIRVTSWTKPRFGTVSCTATACRYRAGPKFAGLDRFVYTVTDARGATARATVTVRD